MFCLGAYLINAQTDKTKLSENAVKEMAQTKSEGELLTKASSLTQDGYLYYAEILTNRLIELRPQSSNYNYRLGFLIMEQRRDYQKSIPLFEQAVKNTSTLYDMYSTKEATAPVDAHYHLAKCYHLDGQFDKAAEQYNLFLTKTKKKSELIEESQLRLQQIETAKKLQASPVNVRIKNLGDKVNSPYADYSSVVSFDGSALYFTSRRPWENNESESYKDVTTNTYLEDVYVSYLDFDSTWLEAERVDFCKPNRNEATIGISVEEKKMYVYQDTTGNGDVYYSDFYNNKFNEIKIISTKNVNTDSWETHVFISPDGQYMIFSSDRPGGYGGRDLYLCAKETSGEWSEPKNMGPQINGPKDEDAPFISVDNRYLFFGTNDARSMGGFDIMMADYQGNATWGNVRNIGYPFNSTNDDLFFTTTIDGRTGYLTSYRGDGNGEKDIYEIQAGFLEIKNFTILKGEVLTTDGSILPENLIFMAKVKCHDCDSGPVNHILYTRSRDGKFATGLQPCKTYTLSYYDASDDKLMGEETFETECTDDYREIYKHLLVDVSKREVIFPKETETVTVKDFTNLEFKHFFGYNKNKLSIKEKELKNFVKTIEAQLKDGRDKITIVIESSASYVPTKTFNSNEELSKVRGENIKYDLIEYFEKDASISSKVTVVVNKTIVQGPAYEGDSKRSEKYQPYQYIYLKTE